jgi:hypothetical protein
MNYKSIYLQLINKAKNRSLSGYSERHHIKPRCLGGTDDESNLIDLTAREHYIAHKLLWKIFPNCKKIFSAYWCMIHLTRPDGKRNVNKISSKEYEVLRQKARNVQIGTPAYNRKPVLQLDKDTHQVLNKFDSTYLAGEYIKTINPTKAPVYSVGHSIYESCANKGNNIKYGFRWIYEGDEVKIVKTDYVYTLEDARKATFNAINKSLNNLDSGIFSGRGLFYFKSNINGANYTSDRFETREECIEYKRKYISNLLNSFNNIHKTCINLPDNLYFD